MENTGEILNIQEKYKGNTGDIEGKYRRLY